MTAGTRDQQRTDAGTLDLRNVTVQAAGESGGWLTIVEDVNLRVPAGLRLGLVGESGSGKSTLGNAILRLLPNNTRTVADGIFLDDTDLLTLPGKTFQTAVRWKRLATVMQNSMDSLNPVATVGRQIRAAVRLHAGPAKRDAAATERRVDELCDLVRLSRTAKDMYPHQLSGGMRQRVSIALSLVADPSVLILDEATTALDVVVQKDILDELLGLHTAIGMTLIFISHDIDAVRYLCESVAVMYAGRIVEYGPCRAVFARPQHPYTACLMKGAPTLRGPRRPLYSLPGRPPPPGTHHAGCPFVDRCPMAVDICAHEQPPVADHGLGQWSACHHPTTDRHGTGEATI